MCASLTGRQAILEQFVADGMTVMFGNPGTVEQGFLDTLREYPKIKYILTLQESVAVLAADAFARAARRPTLVQLHSTPGVGNAIGALYQAKRGHSPLVVIGGDAGIRYAGMDAQMAGDLVAMCEPVCKWSAVVQDPQSLLRMLRRAIKIAGTPPMGPVYLCLPQDVLDQTTSEEVRPTSFPSTRVLPAPQTIAAAADALVGAEHPMIFMGDGVAYSGAQGELAAVAELLGAEVWGVDSGELNIAYDHPLYRGQTGHMFGAASKPILQRGDGILVVGTYIVPEVFPELGEVFSPHAKVVHIDLNAYEIAKNHRVDVGVVSDPKLSLAALAEALKERLTPPLREKAAQRGRALAEQKRAADEKARAADAAGFQRTPMTSALFMSELAKQAPADTVVFDEALTNSPALTRYLPPRKPGSFFQTRGGSLGVGFPGAIGLQLLNPGRTVIGFSGDGGAMYTIQALWTAARHELPAKFVVCNNASYKLLQLNIQQWWQEAGVPRHDYPLCFDLSQPPLGFVEMARGMGVAAKRVEKPHEVAPAIREMLGHPGPYLIDLALEADVHPEHVAPLCGQ
ncbi:thiamine pyrophosphate-binding protein [Opitutaceae bacterium EW11]|nr:thiamine pyrophosphate-binding protein [Opitutaceae bacterium EW11]